MGSYSHRPGAVALSLNGKERQNIVCPYSIDTGNLLSNILTFQCIRWQMFWSMQRSFWVKMTQQLLLELSIGLSTLMGRSLVSGTQILSSKPWSMSVNSMMGLSKNIRECDCLQHLWGGWCRRLLFFAPVQNCGSQVIRGGNSDGWQVHYHSYWHTTDEANYSWLVVPSQSQMGRRISTVDWSQDS